MVSVFCVFAALAFSQTPLLLMSGQSLSQGLETGSASSTTQPYSNTMVSPLAQESAGTGAHAYETYLTNMSAWPTTSLLETSIENPRSGAANYYRSVTGVDLHVVTGSKGGAAYTSIKKGTQPWGNLAASIEAANARNAGGAKCVAFYLEHGESDHNAGTSRSTYTADLVEFQSDVVDKCRSSARGPPPPLYIAQFSSWTATALSGHSTTSLIPLAVYDAARANQGTIVLIGPHYYLTHAADGVHMTSTESRRMGAMAGKVMAYGSTWQPFWPRLTSPVTRSGTTITVYFNVPVPPIVYDTTTITGVNATTRGFEYTCSSSPPSITGVDCTAACSGNVCSCTITLSGTPDATCQTNDKIGYALTGTDGNNGGPTSGPRGPYRDSDTATWQSGALYNWMVHWQEAVPN